MGTPFVPYNPGTIAVTNGLTAIVGTGTDFTKFAEGDTLLVDGLTGRLGTVTDATHADFALAFPGATGAGKTYDWMPASDVTRAITLYASFQRLMVGGNLAALAGLDGTGGDKGVYFTGAGAVSTFALTAVARTLLDDTTTGAILTTLGVSAFIQGLLDDANVGAAQTTLGISTFVKTILDDADASTVLSTLGISTFIKTLLDDADAAAGRATLGAVGITGAETLTGRKIFQAGAAGNNPIANTSLTLGESEVRGNGTGGAFQTFHRPGAYSSHFGLDTDNQWKVGGGSAGAVARKLMLSGKARINGVFGAVAAGNDVPLTLSGNVGFTADSGGVGAGTRIFIPETGVYILSIHGLANGSPPVSISWRINGAASGVAGYSPTALAPATVPGRMLALTAGDYLTVRVGSGTTHSDSSLNFMSLIQLE